MDFDPTIISIGALVVSIISLAIAVYNFGVDRRIQIEQLKGEMSNRLTFRGIEILAHIEKLCLHESEEACELCKKLVKVSKGIVEIRQSLKKYPEPPLFFVSATVPILHQIRSELEDAEPVFDKLYEAVSNSDLKKIGEIAEGLINRLWGSSKSSK